MDKENIQKLGIETQERQKRDIWYWKERLNGHIENH